MSAVKNEVGNRYGRLLVVRRNGTHRGGPAMWLCKCECGNEVTVTGGRLRRGDTKSCGCLVGSNCLPEGEAAFNNLLRKMQYSARMRGYIWELSREQVRVLTKQSCCYCGVEPSQIERKWRSEYTHSGIDRKNSNLGYTEGNCVPCCTECNLAKGIRTVEQFIAHAARVIDNKTKRLS